jgi:hypothetical protein
MRATLVDHYDDSALRPFVEAAVDPAAHLMSDHNSAYVKIAENFDGHSIVNHGEKGYARDDVHNNTAESFNGPRSASSITSARSTCSATSMK